MNADEDCVIFAHLSSGCGATVAHQLPKLRVAGSNPVARSNYQSRIDPANAAAGRAAGLLRLQVQLCEGNLRFALF